MNNLSNFIHNRRKESYQKLTSRFIKSLKQGSFCYKNNRQRKHLIDRIKALESQLGFRSNLKLKHWALAAALGIISVTGHGQDKETSNKKFFQRENERQEIQEANKQTSVFKTSLPSSVSGIAAIPIFEPQPFLGDPISHPIESYGDIDNDGDQDLLITSYFGATKILLNDGNGSFGNELTVRNGASSGGGVYYQEGVGMADMDGDGDIDILLVENGYSNGSSIANLVVLENDGNANFLENLTALTIDLNGSPHLADIDSDGDIDIITEFTPQDGSYSAITTLVNNGANEFINSGSIDNTNNAELTINDIDGDGDVDIILFSYEGRNYEQYPYFVQLNVIKSFTNDGGGNFAEETYELTETEFSIYPYDGVLSGDIVGSNALDLVVVYNSSIVAFVNEGNSTFSVDTIFYDDPLDGIIRSFDDASLVDFDLDGDLDISLAEQYINTTVSPYLYLKKQTFLENNNGIFTLSPIDISSGVDDDSVIPVDIDGDSDVDLIASNSYSIVIYKNDGVDNYTVFQDDLITVVYGNNASIADFDGDGDQDIINSVLTMVLINDGDGNLSIGQNILRETGIITYLVESGDLDDDGDIDFISTLNSNTEGIVTFLNDGNAEFSATDTLLVELSQIKLGDLDQDGDLDIIGSGYGVDATYYLHTFLNDGNGNFTTGQSIGYSYEIDDALLVVDIDNDNDPDVIAGGRNGIIVVENVDGVFGDFVAHFENQDNVGFDRLASGDLDGDGDVDIFANNEEYENGAFDYFLINDGSGLFQELQSSIQTTGYGGSIIEDFDLDGDLDVYVGGGEENEDEFWTNDGSANFTLAGTTGTTLYSPVAGDMDGDGDMDVFGTEYYQSSRLLINTTNVQVLGPTITESDSLALVAFYDGMVGDSWTNNSGWKTTPASEWYGVTLDENLRVVELDLSGNNLFGQIPPELWQLSELYFLNLGGNILYGELSSDIGLLTKLEELELWANSLSGELPSEIGNLSNLTSLMLWSNNFSGTIPASIGNLSNLFVLRFDYNQFEGALPSEFTQLTALNSAEFGNNQLTALPDLSSMTNLGGLGVSYNFLDFDDIIPLTSNLTLGSYAPQKYIDAGQEFVVQPGDNVTLDFTGEIAETDGNLYQWLKDSVIIDGANNLILSLNDIQQLDEGEYWIEITNSSVPGLTLSSTPYNIALEKTYYWVEDAGDWFDLTHWSTISGGEPDVSELPNRFTNVIFDENSFSSDDQIVSVTDIDSQTRPVFKDMDWTGVTNSPTFQIKRGDSPWIENYCHGSLIFDENMSVDNLGGEFYFGSNEDYVLDTKGHFMGDGSFMALGYSSPQPEEKANCTLLSDLHCTHFYLSQGDFLSGGHNLTVIPEDPAEGGYMWIAGDSLTFDVSNSQVEAWGFLSSLNKKGVSLVDDNATIRVTSRLQTTLNNFENLVLFDSVQVRQSAIFEALTMEPGATVFLDSAITVQNEFILNGTAQDSIRILSGLGEGQAIAINKASGIVDGYHLSLMDNTATGGAQFNAFNSKNRGNVTGWNFQTIQVPTIIESDSLALVAIYDALGGGEWTTADGWTTAPASDWYGISIDENLRVSGISLPSNNISGKLDQGLFANLAGLKSINLSGNQLTGSIPSEFFSLELTQLILSNNKLSGELPSPPNEFISTLELFEINDNALYGILPSVGSYPVLQTLRFENNLFEGELSLPFSTMTNLRELIINDNELSGELPSSLGALESLQSLQISNNLLSGSIPESVMAISALQSVDISSNEISGSIGGFANTESLIQLKANNNRIDDLIGLETTTAQVDATENVLDFGDFQSLGETLPQNFLIDPQSFLFDPVDSTHNVGEPILISYEIGGTGNVYQWFKNGEEIAEATNNSIEFESPDTEQEGTYVLRITNPQYQGLDLLTSPFVLKIGSLERDKAALLDLLENVEGFTPDNWAEANTLDNTWEGVTLSTNGLRVERLELPAAVGKVWEGIVPESLIDMTGLQVIDLMGHELNSFPDVSSFPNLQNLDIRGNRLAFLHIVPNLRVSNFEYAPQRRYGETSYDTLDAGENILLEIEDMGRGSVYEWRFAPLIPGQRFNNEVVEVKGTSSRLVIEDINFSNQGTYRVFATHPLATELTIESRNQNVLAKTDLFGTITLNGEPLNTGGDVFVYRQTPSGPFVKEDSTTISESGVYGVRDVVLGNFVVQVKPDRSENDDLLQTYYISSENYREADTLKLRDEIDGIDIEILTFDEGDEGTAQIGGFIESDFDDEPVDEEEARIEARRKVKKAGCAMRRFKAQGRDEQDEVETEIAYYIETDDEGYFNFEGVEPGRYLINIEFPGVPMDESSDVEFIIDENKENQIFDVNVLIDEAGIVVDAEEVLFNWKPYVKDIVVYPNPTEGLVDLDYLVYRDVSDLKIQVLSIQGTLLFDQKLSHSRGNHRTKLDLTKYESGVYFLVFTDESNTFKHELKVTRK